MSGSSGFIGSRLCTYLDEMGYGCFRVARDVIQHQDTNALSESSENKGKKVFIHLAARVHNIDCEEYSLYYQDNVELSKKALILAKQLGCKQFIFMSTIKVFGEVQSAPYTVHTQANPQSAYGRSKLVAEQELVSLNKSLGLHLDIVRIPLVIDMEAKGNIQTLVSVVKKGIPLPFGCLKAPRAYVLRNELVKRIYEISLKEYLGPDYYLHLVCQKEGISTSKLIRWIGKNLGRSVNLVPVPLSFLKILALAGDYCEKYFNKKLPFNSSMLEKIALPMEMVPDSLKLD